jgi:hypothetical protein
MNSEAYNAGYWAGLEGYPVDSNPYPSDTIEFCDWDWGYSHGLED